MNRAEQVRKACGHPVIDSDGHMIESFELLLTFVDEVGGPGAVDRFKEDIRRNPVSTGMGDKAQGMARGAVWSFPTGARDLATGLMPRLMHERAGELGMDHIVLYPSIGIMLVTLHDDDVRRTVVRAYNLMNHELYKPYRDRLTVVAALPMDSPQEALEEIDHVTSKLSFKACTFAPGVARPIANYREAFPAAVWLDCYGIDSPYDYLPVWRKLNDVGLAITCHAGTTLRYLPGQSRSWSNYSYNHLGGHAFFQGQFCKSLIFSGVLAAIRDANFAFLEGGIGWAPDLVYGVREHWERRRLDSLERNLNPERIDRERVRALIKEYADPLVRQRMGKALDSLEAWSPGLSLTSSSVKRVTARDIDDWGKAGFTDLSEVERWFTTRLFFGCEAEDPGVTRAFNARASGMDSPLRPIFGSDIGHWDVIEMGDVVPESYEYFVEEGRIKPEQWRAFVCDNAIALWTGGNARFFEGTSVEKYVREAQGALHDGGALAAQSL